MSWVGHTDVLKAKLREAGADFRWRNGHTMYDIGPDVMEPIPGEDVLPSPPISGVLGQHIIMVADTAEYYIEGEPHPVLPLLADEPEWTPELAQDVILDSKTVQFDD